MCHATTLDTCMCYGSCHGSTDREQWYSVSSCKRRRTHADYAWYVRRLGSCRYQYLKVSFGEFSHAQYALIRSAITVLYTWQWTAAAAALHKAVRSHLCGETGGIQRMQSQQSVIDVRIHTASATSRAACGPHFPPPHPRPTTKLFLSSQNLAPVMLMIWLSL